MRYFIFTLLGIAVFAGVWFVGREFAPRAVNPDAPAGEDQQSKGSTAVINGHVLTVETARTREERARGLSGREDLREDAGMLFVYAQSSMPGFWMQGMHFAIDILWIDGDGKIIEITDSVAPETFPEIFYPSFPVQYVLEVNAGWARKNAVSVGDAVMFHGVF